MAGRFPVNKELALEMAALMAQVRSVWESGESGTTFGLAGGMRHTAWSRRFCRWAEPEERVALTLAPYPAELLMAECRTLGGSPDAWV